MGRHSRQGGPQRPSAEPAESAGSTQHAPGTGRRRRATGAPEDGAAVRGGHPEQHQPGGAWGAVPPPAAAPHGSARGVPAEPRIPRPRSAEPGGPVSGTPPFGTPASGTPVFGTPAFGTPVVSPPGGGPGPRQEYLEAFGETARRAAPGTRADGFPVGSPDGAAAGFPEGVPDAVRQGNAAPRTDRRDGGGGLGPEAAGPTDDGSGARGPRKGSRARTFTGAAAAAVTTALAVVIGGQVADQHREDGGPQARSGDDRADGGTGEASRSQARAGQDAKPADYATQMAEVFPLDPHLTADGRFRPVGGDAKAPGHGKVLRYRVDVEEGLPLDGELFAEAVHKTLNDDRSWAHGGQRTFQRVGSGDADFVISLASPGTTAKWCAKSGLDTTEDNVSCDSAATQRVMINAYRWAQGAKTYGPDKMLAYRQMLINHEVGHRLGHNHEVCSRAGALAPVMMQQTKFLTTDGVTCRPNSWPYPTGQ
ncbi:Protein of unknown function (DUF3152) [Streptomyces noursei ATCC 11455]|uniref:DUF3152 domain-containing protein n=1 Tax=Streptomyces noursei TaxID=1971 RepID=UPI00081D219E|nr:Protein of unknown function (DUF3152) [Streptomyces noursei ATCC 11455]